TGYIGMPIVEISGNGTGATAVANIDADGNLIGITITNPGIGYTEATAVISGGGGSGFISKVNLSPNVSGGFTKRGAGMVTLMGENTFTGPTVIESGILELTGSISGSTSITANSGAILNVLGVSGGFSRASGQMLKGNGTVLGDVAMNAGSKLAAGEIPGMLTLDGNLALTLAVTPANSGALQFELGSVSNSDKIAFTTGALTIGTGVLGFDDFAFTTLAGFGAGTYTLFDGISAIDGAFDTSKLTGVVGGLNATLGFSNNKNDIVLTVIPEPGSATLLLVGVSSLLGMRRFRRRSV
ncbi:MAG: hypothetical protein EOP50_10570, partial [Sphingobacteriales bacterium]